jgi:hypothetical protein
MTLSGGADGELRFENAAYSWAKNIEVTQWIGEGVAIDGSFRIELRDSYIHTGSWPEPGGAGHQFCRRLVGSSDRKQYLHRR